MKPSTFAQTASAFAALAIIATTANAYGAELIQDGGFESPYLGPSNWTAPGIPYDQGYYGYLVYPYPTLDGWTYYGAAIINAQGWNPAIGGPTPPGFGGDQFGAVQANGRLSQYFVSPGGELTLSWLTGGRPFPGCCYGGDETYAVEVDGAVVATFSTVSGQSFTPETLALTGVSAGLHNLIFQGLLNRDESAFFDNVSIVTDATTTVPEPETWILVLAGFGALGLMTRLRRREPVCSVAQPRASTDVFRRR